MIKVTDVNWREQMVGVRYIIHIYPEKVMPYYLLKTKGKLGNEDKIDGCVIVLSNETTIECISTLNEVSDKIMVDGWFK